MTPPARAQAAIECLDAILVAAREGGAAADTIMRRYFAERRYAGAKDRRAVRDLAFAAIRRAGEAPASGRAALLGLAADDPAIAAAFDGSAHGPAPIAPGEPAAPAGIAPAWLERELAASGLAPDEWPALVGRAPLDLRVNTARATLADALITLPDARPVAGLPDALRLLTGAAIEDTDLYRSGAIEVQDAGSQLVARAAAVRPGMAVVDLCAGAGAEPPARARR